MYDISMLLICHIVSSLFFEGYFKIPGSKPSPFYYSPHLRYKHRCYRTMGPLKKKCYGQKP